MIYELKVTLTDVGVPVWRKIQVDSRTSFLKLHHILQICFDWEDYHLHQFAVRKTNGKKTDNVLIQSDEDESFGFFGRDDTYEEEQETIADWFKVRNDKITYTYDFGDSWEHDIVLTKKIKHEKNAQYPRCVAAKNYAPQEDSRGEIFNGEVDLECVNSGELLEKINMDLTQHNFEANEKTKEKQIDHWEEILLQSKEFLKLKPWEKMGDEHIFSVIDPVTNEQLFCSVMGAAGEVFGLAVYVGKDGYKALKLIFDEQNDDNFNLAARQRSIVLSFEDREDLGKEEYSLIKSYDIPFRGRKSWPSYRSYRPGFYPWLMDEEEARVMLLALEQTFEVYKEINAGQEIPDLLAEEKVFTRVPSPSTEDMFFKNEIVNLKGFIEENNAPVEIAVSPFELKKLDKLKNADASVEFFVNYVNMPVREDGGERPVFPVLALAVDHKGELIVYQKITVEELKAELVQRELLSIFQSIGGIPDALFMDLPTARLIEPLTRRLSLNVQTNQYLPIAKMVVEKMENQLPF